MDLFGKTPRTPGGIELQKGDHLISWRTGYTHHGLYAGGGIVIARTREGVAEHRLEDFTQGQGLAVVSHSDRAFSRDECVNRARSRLGESGYSLRDNNCEHFVNWCITGFKTSSQVLRVRFAACELLGPRRGEQFTRTAVEAADTIARAAERAAALGKELSKRAQSAGRELAQPLNASFSELASAVKAKAREAVHEIRRGQSDAELALSLSRALRQAQDLAAQALRLKKPS
ncbi:MAG: lecithin retinol acyltransferase family protein [Succinivibrio sp.]|jgi:hypothetical protein|nr:lecithin retinol acyltransferase family protein [Succinivibrio sp.]